MASIVSVHSFRGGTGKSNTTANVAALLAKRGLRVGVIDTDILSPGIHVLFGLREDAVGFTLNDYLANRSTIQDAAYDVTPEFVKAAGRGQVFLIPSSIKAGEITRVLREGYDVGLLNDGFQSLIATLDLDVLMIDTHPGLNEETLLSIAISDALVIILRPDQQDYQGTGVTVEVSRKFEVPAMYLVVNKVPALFEPAAVKAHVEEMYHCDVAAVLPHSDALMALGSSSLFVEEHPDDPVTEALCHLADLLES
jgi:septum site-determining protein MinD